MHALEPASPRGGGFGRRIDWRRWQRLENGTVNPTVRTLLRVSTALGTTFWKLLTPG